MKGDMDDWWWVLLGIWLIISVGLPAASVMLDVPPSPCVKNTTIQCDSWSSDCNINMTVEETSGPFYNKTTTKVVQYYREVCLEYENGTINERGG